MLLRICSSGAKPCVHLRFRCQGSQRGQEVATQLLGLVNHTQRHVAAIASPPSAHARDLGACNVSGNGVSIVAQFVAA
jgi:hypothetical protein